MKKTIKVLGLALLALVTLFALAVFAVLHFFNPNDYKQEIQRLAHDRAGIELTLKGDIAWSIFPWLGLELHDASIASTITPDKPLAHVQTLKAAVRLLPLLQKEVQMSDLRADGLTLTLVRDAQGNTNWQQLGPPKNSTPATPSTPGTDNPPMLQFNIGSIVLDNAKLLYTDDVTHKSLTVDELKLNTGAIGGLAALDGRPSIPLKVSGRFNDGSLNLKSNITTDLQLDLNAQRYQLNNFKYDGELSGKPLNDKALPLALEGPLVIDLSAHTADAKALKITAGSLHASTDLHISAWDTALKFDGTLTASPFNLRRLLGELDVALPAMADASALEKVALTSGLSGTADSLSLSSFQLTLDSTTLTGSLAITRFQPPALRLALQGDALDADRYLLPKKTSSPSTTKSDTGKGAPSTAPSDAAWSREPLLPLVALRDLDLEATLSLKTMTLARLPISNAALKLNAKNGLITVSDLHGSVADGRVNLKARLDARQSTPQLNMQSDLSSIAIEKIINALDGKAPLRGKAQISTDLTTSGNSLHDWVNGLDGKAQFTVTNGALLNTNIEQQLCKAIATVNRKTLSSEHGSKDTPFRELKGSFNLDNGVARSNDLKVSIPGLTATGQGDLDVRALSIDYRIGLILEGDQAAMPDPACQINKNYAGIAWPLRCRGPLADASKACTLDTEALAPIAARLAGDKLMDKLDKKLGDKNQGLKDALKGLFKK